MFQPVFTTEFLEKELGRQVTSFRVAPGANPGDNFIGAIYALEVHLKPKEEYSTLFSNSDETDNETVYLVGKFFPNNDLHSWLISSNIFHKELLTYTSLIKELEAFLHEKNGKVNPPTLPFATIVGGKAIDFSKCSGTATPLINQHVIKGAIVDNDTFHYGPMDNFLLLTDVRKTFGFRMTSKSSGLDWNHCSLTVEKLAEIHAISWAYQQDIGSAGFLDKFPFLRQKPLPPKSVRQAFHSARFEAAAAIVETYLGTDSPVAEGMRRISEVACDILAWFHTDDLIVNGIQESDLNSYMRVISSQISGKHEPWRVFTHGDCWTNNILFKYDQLTALPSEAILIDFQVSKLACPTIDLAYLLYISTSSDFRKEHLQSILQKYHDIFIQKCNSLGCKLLPDFTMKSLLERLRRSKLYAMCLSVIVIPNILQDKEIIDINNNQEPQCKLTLPYKSLLHKTTVELAMDLYEDGIL